MVYREMALPMDIPGAEMMGNHLREKLKYCGKGVQLYPWCKIVHAENTIIDDYTRIYDNVWIDAGPSLTIGKWCMLTWQVLIEGGGDTRIGDRVLIGPGTKLISGLAELNGHSAIQNIRDITESERHNDRMPDDCCIIKQAPIIIEDDVYIGANCTILAGTTIHEGAVIGANSFVRGEVEAWSVYAGTPAKPVSTRKPFTEKVRDEIQKMNWKKNY